MKSQFSDIGHPFEESSKSGEDALYYLPHAAASAHQKGEIIYSCEEPSTSLYLVCRGRVKVSRIFHTGREVVIDIYQREEFFGESALAGPLLPRSEQAMALEKATVMMWSVSQVEYLIRTRPALGIALLQMVSQPTGTLSNRLLCFAAESNRQRLIRELIRLSERLGTPEIDGSIRMMPLTQTLLAQCVGTSREIVTSCMNRLRENGCVLYSRKAITLYPDALKTQLRGDETIRAMTGSMGSGG